MDKCFREPFAFKRKLFLDYSVLTSTIAFSFYLLNVFGISFKLLVFMYNFLKSYLFMLFIIFSKYKYTLAHF